MGTIAGQRDHFEPADLHRDIIQAIQAWTDLHYAPNSQRPDHGAGTDLHRSFYLVGSGDLDPDWIQPAGDDVFGTQSARHRVQIVAVFQLGGFADTTSPASHTTEQDEYLANEYISRIIGAFYRRFGPASRGTPEEESMSGMPQGVHQGLVQGYRTAYAWRSYPDWIAVDVTVLIQGFIGQVV